MNDGHSCILGGPHAERSAAKVITSACSSIQPHYTLQPNTPISTSMQPPSQNVDIFRSQILLALCCPFSHRGSSEWVCQWRISGVHGRSRAPCWWHATRTRWRRVRSWRCRRRGCASQSSCRRTSAGRRRRRGGRRCDGLRSGCSARIDRGRTSRRGWRRLGCFSSARRLVDPSLELLVIVERTLFAQLGLDGTWAGSLFLFTPPLAQPRSALRSFACVYRYASVSGQLNSQITDVSHNTYLEGLPFLPALA
jgi:hypothetical protein